MSLREEIASEWLDDLALIEQVRARVARRPRRGARGR